MILFGETVLNFIPDCFEPFRRKGSKVYFKTFEPKLLNRFSEKVQKLTLTFLNLFGEKVWTFSAKRFNNLCLSDWTCSAKTFKHLLWTVWTFLTLNLLNLFSQNVQTFTSNCLNMFSETVQILILMFFEPFQQKGSNTYFKQFWTCSAKTLNK